MSSTVEEPEPRQSAADYSLGDLTIRAGSAQVLRDGKEISLPRLSFDLLLVLVRAAPNLVTIDELMNRVWPGLVVTPETVSQRVKLLRGALEDDPRNPRYVAGVRGRGYRIVASVAVIEPNAKVSAPVSESIPRKSALPRILWASAIFVGLATLGVVVLRPQATPPTVAVLPERSVAVLPFENLGQSPQDATLAFGVPETLLHRLAAFKNLTVIARRSSFVFTGKDDIRDIGRKLGARYVVEGSLQSDQSRLRVTAQLIDATDGSHVWSMQFDRKPQDVFAIQDEIAGKIAQAMQLAVASKHSGRVVSTRNFDAYLAYMQAQQRLASERFADARAAVEELERAVRIDPQFVEAHVALAHAYIVQADGEVTENRRENFEKARVKALELLQRAQQIDPGYAEVYIERGWLQFDQPQAKAELRRGLELNPNSAVGYARLTDLLWSPADWGEAVNAIDRARQLDPLASEFDNTRARVALYLRSNIEETEQLSLKVLEREPSSSQALMRLGEINWCCGGQYARGARYIEQSVQSDPDNEFARRMLLRAYLDMADPDEAEAVISEARHPVAARTIPLLLYRRDWRAAAERTYEEPPRATGEAIDAGIRAIAVAIHARNTGEYDRARRFLEQKAAITWNAEGSPQFASYTFDAYYCVALGEVLLLMGEQQRGTRLLEEILVRFDYQAHQLGRGEMWFLRPKTRVLALLKRDEDALAALELCFARNILNDAWLVLDLDPAYDHLRALPRFKAVVAQIPGYVAEQRKALEQMRAAQLIAHRTAPKVADRQ